MLEKNWRQRNSLRHIIKTSMDSSVRVFGLSGRLHFWRFMSPVYLCGLIFAFSCNSLPQYFSQTDIFIQKSILIYTFFTLADSSHNIFRCPRKSISSTPSVQWSHGRPRLHSCSYSSSLLFSPVLQRSPCHLHLCCPLHNTIHNILPSFSVLKTFLSSWKYHSYSYMINYR